MRMNISRVFCILAFMVLAFMAAADAVDVAGPTATEDLLEKIAVWAGVLTSVVGTFSVIAALTPTKRDDRIAGKLMKVVDFLGANFGAAKNKNAKDGK